MKIDKGVPIPKVVMGPKKRKYPFDEMEVGDSFLVTNIKLSSVNSSVYVANLRDKKKRFTVRAVENGARVWRIK